MTRIIDHKAFLAHCRERAAMPFIWGANDCCSFPADAAVAMGNADFLHGMRRYSSAIGARRVLTNDGYEDLDELAQDRLERIPTSLAMPGDIALVASENNLFRFSLASFQGAQIVGPGEFAMVRLPRKAALAAFKVR